MTKRKLKPFVLPTLYIIVVLAIALGVSYIGQYFSGLKETDYNYSMSTVDDEVDPVVSEQTPKIIKPYTDESVSVKVNYYSKDDDEKTQQNSLINYSNVYLQNSGILYGADKKFDVVSTLDGKVTDVKEDEILGKVVEIQHDKNIVTLYYSLDEVKVNTGDEVLQGTIIGTSGKNYLEKNNENVLIFEVYKDGNLMDPEDFYNLDLTTLE